MRFLFGAFLLAAFAVWWVAERRRT